VFSVVGTLEPVVDAVENDGAVYHEQRDDKKKKVEREEGDVVDVPCIVGVVVDEERVEKGVGDCYDEVEEDVEIVEKADLVPLELDELLGGWVAEEGGLLGVGDVKERVVATVRFVLLLQVDVQVREIVLGFPCRRLWGRWLVSLFRFVV
jgi:hypothetical protein